jgi:hypothetical protein
MGATYVCLSRPRIVMGVGYPPSRITVQYPDCALDVKQGGCMFVSGMSIGLVCYEGGHIGG